MRERAKKNVMETSIKEREESSPGTRAETPLQIDHNDADCPSAGSRGLKRCRCASFERYYTRAGEDDLKKDAT